MPLGFYGDIADIDAARVPVLLPSGVYPAVNRDLLLAQTGGESMATSGGSLGALDYRAFGGSLQIVLPSQAGAPVQVSDYAVPYVAGGRLLWEAPLDGLRLGVTGAFLRAKSRPFFRAPTRRSMRVRTSTTELHRSSTPCTICSSRPNLPLHAPCSPRTIRLCLPNRVLVSEAGYGLAAYRVRRWLEPGVYYSLAYNNRNLGAEQDDRNVQHDLAGTLRFDINNFWIVKVEGHFMHGTELINGGNDAARAHQPRELGCLPHQDDRLLLGR